MMYFWSVQNLQHLRDIVQKQQVLFRTLQKLSKPITNTRVKSGKHGTSTSIAATYIFTASTCTSTIITSNAEFQHFIPRFIKTFSYFADLTQRGDSEWKEAQRRWRQDDFKGKLYCDSIQKKLMHETLTWVALVDVHHSYLSLWLLGLWDCHCEHTILHFGVHWFDIGVVRQAETAQEFPVGALDAVPCICLLLLFPGAFAAYL